MNFSLGADQIGRIVASAILLIFLVGYSAVGWYYDYVNGTVPGADSGTVTVSIPKGASVRQIKTILAENGLVGDDVRFLILARLSGLATRLQAGEFDLTKGNSPLAVLQELSRAKPKQYSLTIPEGRNIFEIADIVAQKGWADKEEFLGLALDPEFTAKQGIKGDSLEGYLFPDTYLLPRSSFGAEKIIAHMLRRFHAVWAELTAGRADALDKEKTVILASVVEKETADPRERPLIAGVFYNRLKIGMKLQSDPTVVYRVKNYSGKITRKMLKAATPYNTYVVKGLPAGPICNPGKEALEAVLDPEKSDFLYFVSNNAGGHKFSKSLQEHNKAVRKYQR